MPGLLPGPLLVAAAVAGPDLHGGAVGGASPGHVEAETGPATNDGAVGVEGPLLVAAAVAVLDLHPGARRRGEARHVEALVAIHLQFPIGQEVHCWFAAPLQSQICSSVPLAVAAPGTSRHRLELTPRRTPVVPPLRYRWLAQL